MVSRAPIDVTVECGKTYWWCACGLSQNQPFCDGSHKATTLSPLRYQATETGIKRFCVCKQTRTPPPLARSCSPASTLLWRGQTSWARSSPDCGLTFPMRTGVPPINPKISRFPRKERVHMPGSQTTPGRRDARDVRIPPCCLPRQRSCRRPEQKIVFAAQWLAYAYPCQRFASAVTNACA